MKNSICFWSTVSFYYKSNLKLNIKMDAADWESIGATFKKDKNTARSVANFLRIVSLKGNI